MGSDDENADDENAEDSDDFNQKCVKKPAEILTAFFERIPKELFCQIVTKFRYIVPEKVYNKCMYRIVHPDG